MSQRRRLLVLFLAMVTLISTTAAFGESPNRTDEPKRSATEPITIRDKESKNESPAALGVLLIKSGNIVTVVGVIPGSGAAWAGISLGDELRSLGDKQITSISEVTEVLDHAQPGQQLDVKVNRKGQTLAFKATLGTVESTFGHQHQVAGGPATADSTQSAISKEEIRVLNQQVYLLNQQIGLLQGQLKQLQSTRPTIVTIPSDRSNQSAEWNAWWNAVQRGDAGSDPKLFQ